MSSSDGYGPPCTACGHPATTHGFTFCRLMVGTLFWRYCDCAGYTTAPSPDSQIERLRARLVVVEECAGVELAEANRKIDELQSQLAALREPVIESAGMCGAQSPSLMDAPVELCTLHHGHSGWHASARTLETPWPMRWSV